MKNSIPYFSQLTLKYNRQSHALSVAPPKLLKKSFYSLMNFSVYAACPPAATMIYTPLPRSPAENVIS